MKLGKIVNGVCPVHGLIGGTEKHLGFDHEAKEHICLACIRNRVEVLEEALCVAVVTMASVWPDDFRTAFGDEKIMEFVDNTKPDEDFRVENYMKEVIVDGH